MLTKKYVANELANSGKLFPSGECKNEEVEWMGATLPEMPHADKWCGPNATVTFFGDHWYSEPAASFEDEKGRNRTLTMKMTQGKFAKSSEWKHYTHVFFPGVYKEAFGIPIAEVCPQLLTGDVPHGWTAAELEAKNNTVYQNEEGDLFIHIKEDEKDPGTWRRYTTNVDEATPMQIIDDEESEERE